MDEQAPRVPKIRHEKNFIVEENIDALQWPPECAACGGPAEVRDKISLKERFKGFGEIKVEVDGIPYCLECQPKIRASRRMDKAVMAVALIIGIPVGLLVLVSMMQDRNVTFIYLPCIFIPVLLLAYGLAWLLISFPIKSILRHRFVEPVSARLIEEQKSSGSKGISVVIEIPNKDYAEKFAQLNP
jgi:uncharacterized protein (DUF983 family)